MSGPPRRCGGTELRQRQRRTGNERNERRNPGKRCCAGKREYRLCGGILVMPDACSRKVGRQQRSQGNRRRQQRFSGFADLFPVRRIGHQIGRNPGQHRDWDEYRIIQVNAVPGTSRQRMQKDRPGLEYGSLCFSF